MYERSWEGEVEIRVPGKDSLRVVARLWRHDDAGGTDWGGQLEIDVATATRLGTGEYAIVLPDGRESTVRLSRGASRARSAYPTFAGRGAPPFGSDLSKEQLAANSSDDEPQTADDDLADAEAETKASPAKAATEDAAEAARPARRRSRSNSAEPVAAAEQVEDLSQDDSEDAAQELVPDEADPRETPAAADDSEDAPVESQSTAVDTTTEPAAEAEREAKTAAPTRSQATPAPAVHTPEIRKMADSPRTVARAVEGVSPTEVMARAYLQAVETRRNLDGSSAEGFEALILGGVAGIVDELAGLFEQRLRGERSDRQRGGDWLQQRFIVLDWFRAVVEGYEPMAATSSDLQSLIDTAIALFDGDAAQAAA